MNELKRFVVWCIKNDLAFTNIAEAVIAFRRDDDSPTPTLWGVPIPITATGCGRHPCICGTTVPCAPSFVR